MRRVRRPHRFLAYSAAALAATATAGRLLTRSDGRREDPAAGDHLGSIRGEPVVLRGPRASRLYTERFPGSREGGGTLVFTHGYCLTEAVWHYQKRDLAGGRHGLVTWDLPGHGHSPQLGRGLLTLDVAADALARVVDEHAPGGVVLVGHSLGGVVTLAYLLRHAETARRTVRGAVLVSTPMLHFARSVAGGWPGASLEARALGLLFRYVVESDLAERTFGRDVGMDDVSRLSYRLVRWGFGRNPSPSHVRFVRDAIASVPPEVRAATYRVMTGADLSPRLGDVDANTLVMIGGRDRLVNPDESRLLATRLRRAKPVLYPDAGHAMFLEQPDAFNADVRRFADRRLAARALRKAGSA